MLLVGRSVAISSSIVASVDDCSGNGDVMAEVPLVGVVEVGEGVEAAGTTTGTTGALVEAAGVTVVTGKAAGGD